MKTSLFQKSSLLLQVTSADPAGLLGQLNREGIVLYDVTARDDLTMLFRIESRDLPGVEIICGRRGDERKILQRKGFYWWVKTIFRRPVLAAGWGILLAVTLMLPGRVLFIQVEGNASIPARQILAAAEESGIGFGAAREDVRSEKMKNSLLSRIPQLQWAGINTRGCTAVISVRERARQPAQEEAPGLYAIVAERDGIVTECTVTAGTALCAPGQAVKAGQILISPYTDCGIAIRVERPQGEIFAQTAHDIRLVMPEKRLLAADSGEVKRKISLIFGKKRIKLWKDSGIWDSTCGRMYEEYYLTLPGDFQLPVCLAVETLTGRNTREEIISRRDALEALTGCARRTTEETTLAGQILRQVLTLEREADTWLLEGQLLCREMIGREKAEKIGDTDEQNDGADR